MITARFALPPDKYPTPESRVLFFEALENRLSQLPPVAASSLAGALPFIPEGTTRLTVLLDTDPAAATAMTALGVPVGDHYFAALDLPIHRGRAFHEKDGTPGQDTVIVNQRFVSPHAGIHAIPSAVLRRFAITRRYLPSCRLSRVPRDFRSHTRRGGRDPELGPPLPSVGKRIWQPFERDHYRLPVCLTFCPHGAILPSEVERTRRWPRRICFKGRWIY